MHRLHPHSTGTNSDEKETSAGCKYILHMVGFYMGCDKKCIEGKLKENKWYEFIHASEDDRKVLLKKKLYLSTLNDFINNNLYFYNSMRGEPIEQFCSNQTYINTFQSQVNAWEKLKETKHIKQIKEWVKELLKLMKQYNEKSASEKKSGKGRFKF